jgi:hypothetical protein
MSQQYVQEKVAMSCECDPSHGVMEPGKVSFTRCGRMEQEIAGLAGDAVNEVLGKTGGTASC